MFELDGDSSTHGVNPSDRGNLSEAGGVGVRGVSRMDAAAKPTWTYLRRPRTPTPPRHPTECQLLSWPLRLPASGRHYQGAGRSPAEKHT
ncbi:hypothetical protein AL480_04350 [Stenotrophomonas maltophilia]|nr:hypothetical protein AL480_04350 [Stenotrophomonas maltophilia]